MCPAHSGHQPEKNTLLMLCTTDISPSKKRFKYTLINGSSQSIANADIHSGWIITPTERRFIDVGLKKNIVQSLFSFYSKTLQSTQQSRLVTISAPFSPVREENWLQNALRTRHCLSVASLTSLAFWSQFLAKGRPCGGSFAYFSVHTEK